MAEPKLTLSECALRLRNGNPEAFELFVEQLTKYHQTLLDAVVQADVNEVLVAQGRAQTTVALLRIFKECTVVQKPRPLPFVKP